jgi:hypothetical protein
MVIISSLVKINSMETFFGNLVDLYITSKIKVKNFWQEFWNPTKLKQINKTPVSKNRKGWI